MLNRLIERALIGYIEQRKNKPTAGCERQHSKYLLILSTRFDILGVPLNGGEGVQITVNVVDVNDNSPVFTPDFIQVL